jgi:acyl carrier protein
MNQTTTNQIRELLAGVLRVELAAVPADLQFGDLPQWDSMGHMEVMVALEKEFGVEVSADTITELVSIPAISAYIEARNG